MSTAMSKFTYLDDVTSTIEASKPLKSLPCCVILLNQWSPNHDWVLLHCIPYDGINITPLNIHFSNNF